MAYRKYLGDILEDQSTVNGQSDIRTTARSGVSNGDNGEVVWQAVVDSYLQTEKKLLEEVESGNESLRKMSIAIRKLFDYYRFKYLFFNYFLLLLIFYYETNKQTIIDQH